MSLLLLLIYHHPESGGPRVFLPDIKPEDQDDLLLIWQAHNDCIPGSDEEKEKEE